MGVSYFGFTKNGVRSFDGIFTNEIALKNVYYIIQIIAGVALIIGAIIGVWQYVLTARSERAKLGKEQIQKAIDLAEYYKDNILPEFELFKYIFAQAKIKNILDTIKPQDMDSFDKNELEKNLSTQHREEISKIMKSEKMLIILGNAEKIYEKDLKSERCIENENEEGIAFRPEQVRKVMSTAINRTLNNMEYFAMNFTHGTADETVVYQSLHQTYTQIVQLFYYNIAINNEANGEQYYTNVVELYKTWHDRSVEAKNQVANTGRSSIIKGNKADNLMK